jgi:hypothetical protein
VEEGRRWEQARRREEELARLRALEEDAANWEKSQRILAYVAALRSAAAEGARERPLPAALQEWLAWAEAHSNTLNPARKTLGKFEGLGDVALAKD